MHPTNTAASNAPKGRAQSFKQVEIGRVQNVESSKSSFQSMET